MRWHWLLLVLVVSGCAHPIPFKVPEAIPLPAGATPEELLQSDWREGLPAVRLRQSAIFEWQGRKLPMVGLLNLDRAEGSLRLLALNDLGMKLFVLQLEGESRRLQLFQPQLGGYPGLEDLLADALRRLFLWPAPAAGARLERTDCAYTLLLPPGEQWARYMGAPLRLVAIGEEAIWRAGFYEFGQENGLFYPRGMVLEDWRLGYRLLVRNEEMKAYVEPPQ